jgi:hypothetical protein
MRGRAFLDLAREILRGGGERHWRGASGRAYYSLMLECREALFRWGFPLPPRDNVHTFVRLRFTVPVHADLRTIGDHLERLGRLRNQADYDLTTLIQFARATYAQRAVQDAGSSLVLLDAIDGDGARRAAAVAAIRAAFP